MLGDITGVEVGPESSNYFRYLVGFVYDGCLEKVEWLNDWIIRPFVVKLFIVWANFSVYVGFIVCWNIDVRTFQETKLNLVLKLGNLSDLFKFFLLFLIVPGLTQTSFELICSQG